MTTTMTTSHELAKLKEEAACLEKKMAAAVKEAQKRGVVLSRSAWVTTGKETCACALGCLLLEDAAWGTDRLKAKMRELKEKLPVRRFPFQPVSEYEVGCGLLLLSEGFDEAAMHMNYIIQGFDNSTRYSSALPEVDARSVFWNVGFRMNRIAGVE